ncbi:hypothetical protein ACFQX6_02185 [Streptosporangium lutulentum]
MADTLGVLGVRPDSAFVIAEKGEFVVRFGPWLLRTPLSNVLDATLTGPYSPWKVFGPRMSLTDRGVSFGTNARRGVCVRFRTPVSALAPGGFLTHPGATLTVSDPEGLMRALTEPRNA